MNPCNCDACLLRRALERITASYAKVVAERDEAQARLQGAIEGARTLREENERLRRAN